MHLCGLDDGAQTEFKCFVFDQEFQTWIQEKLEIKYEGVKLWLQELFDLAKGSKNTVVLEYQFGERHLRVFG